MFNTRPSNHLFIELENDLRTSASQVTAKLQSSCLSKLTLTEQQLLKLVQDLPFDKRGAWFRPYHNLIVPMSMCRILYSEYGDPPRLRHLVAASIVHDAGYAMCEIRPNSNGERQMDSTDLRTAHMREGEAWVANLFKDYFRVAYSPAQQADILRIVRTHDNPYLNRTLPPFKEDYAHRDADRTFVMTAASFWKDLVSYCTSQKWCEKMTEAKLPCSAVTLLRIRAACFYRDENELPSGWDHQRFPFRKELQAFGTTGSDEVPNTAAGKNIIDWLFSKRAHEVARLGNENPRTLDFQSIFEHDLSVLIGD